MKIAPRRASTDPTPIAKAVARIAAGAEPDFLLLSDDLRALHTGARDLEQWIRTLGESLQGIVAETQLDQSIGPGTKALSGLDRELEQAGSGLQPLHGILELLHLLNQHGERLVAVAALVGVLGRAFAIESARTETSRAAFATFVPELRDLGTRIQRIGQDIEEQSRTSRQELSQTIHTISAALHRLRQLRDGASEGVERTTQRVRHVVALSRDALQQAEEQTQVISKHVHSAMFYLQFGDIVRQKLEHVSSALEEGATGEPSELAGIVAIQIRQIEVICMEVQQAEQQLRSAFHGLATETRTLTEALAKMSGNRGGSGGNGSALTELQQGLSSLAELHARGRKIGGQARGLLDRAAQVSERVSLQLADIRPINSEMHFQALNATIKTYALGVEGAALASLTGEVSGVSKDSGKLVNSIVAILTELQNATKSTAGHTEAEKSDGLALEETTLLFAQLDHRLQDAQKAAATLADKQFNRLREAETRLRFLSATVTRLVETTGKLTTLQKSLGPVSMKTMSTIAERYTMESERQIHLGMAGETASVADANDNMEFF